MHKVCNQISRFEWRTVVSNSIYMDKGSYNSFIFNSQYALTVHLPVKTFNRVKYM